MATVRNQEHREKTLESLRNIYGETSEDLAVVKKGPSGVERLVSRLVHWSLGLCLIVAVISVIVLRQTLFSPLSPHITVETDWTTPPQVGQTAVLEIRYANPERHPLKNVRLDVNLPGDFVVENTMPAPTDASLLLWQLPELGRASDGRIEIRGRVNGSVNGPLSAQVIATFTPGNSEAEYSSVTTATETVAASPYTLTVAAQEAVVPGEEVVYTAQVSAPDDQELLPLTVVGMFPPTFQISGDQAALEHGWALVWGEGRTATVEVRGVFTADAGGVQNVTWRLVQMGEGEEEIRHAEAITATDIRGDGLLVALVGNGEVGETNVSRGKSLRLSLRIKNTSTAPVTADRVVLDFAPGAGIPVSWGTASLDGGVVRSEGVVYTLSGAPLAPGEERTFNPSFPVRSDVRAGDVETFTVTARFTALNRTIATMPLNVRLMDIPNATFSLEPLSGPIPPVIGAGTTYEVSLTLPATSHALSAVSLSATLPSGVAFGSMLEGGEMTVDNGALRLAPFDRAAQEERVITFTLVAVPTAADAGSILPLLRDVTLTGTDAQVGEAFTLPLGALTTGGPK